MIKIKNLNKYFNHKKDNEIHVINNTSIEFPESGLITILGESGSGKTTLLNVIGGLDDFNSGSIQIDDFIINKYSSSKMDRIRNEKIGYIFQNYNLLTNKTVLYNLFLSLQMYDLSLKEAEDRIDYVLKSVGMLRYKKKKINELSGGQQQRIAIARALIKSPSLILADEPTGNLDEKNTLQVMSIIKKISKKIPIIMVSHEQNIAYSYADYIIKVADGKIISNESNLEIKAYEIKEDQNIYLQDYNHANIQNEYCNIDFYSNTNNKIALKIIYKNGKYYIKSNEDIILIDDKNEIKIQDNKKQPLDISKDILTNDYNLDVLPYKKNPQLSFKDIISLAFNNLKNIKKTGLFLMIILFVISITVIICSQGMISAKNINKQELTHSDSHIYDVIISKGENNYDNELLSNMYEDMYYEIQDNNENIDALLTPNIDILFKLPNFTQISKIQYKISGFSYIPLGHLNSKNIIYGRIPENIFEIVIDEWVLKNALDSSTLNNFMTIRSFINSEVIIKGTNISCKIVGICNTNENSVYLNKWLLMAIFPSNIKKNSNTVCSLSEIKKIYKTYDDLSLNNDEIYITDKSTKLVNSEMIFNEDYKLSFNVKGKIDLGDTSFFAIVSDEVYEKFIVSIIRSRHDEISYYCNNLSDKENLIKYLNNIYNYYANEANIKYVIEHISYYDNNLEPYIIESNKLVTSRFILVLTVIIVSIIIVFFSMKSFTSKNLYEIGVYRAIGISKESIILSYGFEILFISLKTTIFGSIICFAISKFLSTIPTISLSLNISIQLTLVCMIGLTLINMIAGIIPIVFYLHLTPSQLLNKYDI